MFLGPRYTSDVLSIVSFTFTMWCHLIGSLMRASFCLAKFVWFTFAELRVQRLATKQNAEFMEVVENAGPILSHLRTRVHEFSVDVGDPSYFPIYLPDCLSSFVQKIFAIKFRSRRKPNRCIKFFGPQILGRYDPDVSTADC